jgi:hypothetical protein
MSLTKQEQALLGSFDDWQDQRAARPYGRLPRGLDEATLAAVNKAMVVCIEAKDEHGVTRPFVLPQMLALRIVQAIRGD